MNGRGRVRAGYLQRPAMNFLGHLYLSGHEPEVIVGNFMGDGVKGRDLQRFTPGIREGIRLHRRIDSFTDRHPLALQGRERLRPHAGRWSGVVLDIFFDHVLAVEWADLHDEPLDAFVERMYGLLPLYQQHMPPRIRHMLPDMIAGDWLRSYATLEGIGRALDGLSRRVTAGAPMRGAERVVERHYEAYKSEFLEFLPDLQEALKA